MSENSVGIDTNQVVGFLASNRGGNRRLAGPAPFCREKARAIYDWIVDNMRRDPDTKGCGLGDVEGLLSSQGVKCADLHSVFVAMMRHPVSGIRRRGLRVRAETSEGRKGACERSAERL